MTTKSPLGVMALVSLLSLGMSATPSRAAGGGAHAQGQSAKKAAPGNGGSKSAAAHEPGKAKDDSVVVIDRDGHRRVYREFIAHETLPPGLAKRDSLPPGLSKQLREKGRLPPGLEKHLTPVPPALDGRFPGIPDHWTRYFVGRDLIVLDTRTNLIVGLMRDFLPSP